MLTPDEDVHFELFAPGQPPRFAVEDGEATAKVLVAMVDCVPVGVGLTETVVVTLLIDTLHTLGLVWLQPKFLSLLGASIPIVRQPNTQTDSQKSRQEQRNNYGESNEEGLAAEAADAIISFGRSICFYVNVLVCLIVRIVVVSRLESSIVGVDDVWVVDFHR